MLVITWLCWYSASYYLSSMYVQRQVFAGVGFAQQGGACEVIGVFEGGSTHGYKI